MLLFQINNGEEERERERGQGKENFKSMISMDVFNTMEMALIITLERKIVR